MNLNELAKEISKLEGGKRNLNIADIKEVIKCLSVVVFRTSETQEDMLDWGESFFKNGKKWIGKGFGK